MANTMRGIVMEVRPTQSLPIKSGGTFSKREMILDCTKYDSITGERGFTNTPCFTFTQERCSLLDAITPGMVVEVSFDINGRYHQPKNTYFNDVRGYKVEVIRQSANAAPQQPQAMPQQAQYQQPQQPQAQYQQAPQPAQQQYQQPQYGQANNPYGLPQQGNGEPF